MLSVCGSLASTFAAVAFAVAFYFQQSVQLAAVFVPFGILSWVTYGFGLEQLLTNDVNATRSGDWLTLTAPHPRFADAFLQYDRAHDIQVARL